MKKLVYVLVFILLAVPAFATDVLVMDENDLNNAMLREFVEQGYGDEAEFEFFGGKTTFALPNVTLAKIMVSNLKLDEDASKFEADAEIFAEGEMVEKTHLTGKYYRLVSAYVPRADIAKGAKITENLLEEIKVRENKVKDNNLITPEKLVGMQARKTLKAGRMIAEREVGQVIAVHKADVVTAVYKSKGLQITSKAEALEDGAVGQRIELENIKSGKRFRAKVTDVNIVEIENE